MPARATRTTQANWRRFLRHVSQKHGLDEVQEIGQAKILELSSVLDRPGITGTWCGILARRLHLKGPCTEAGLENVFAKSRVMVERDDKGLPEIYNLRSKFDSSRNRSSPLRPVKRKTEPAEAETAPALPPEPEQAAAADQSAFFGLVFGLPKSVSALALFDDSQVLLALEKATEAYRDAVVETFDHLARCRAGRAGATSEPGEGVIAASWIHRGSGAGEPHWHVHLCLSNATWRAGDETGRAVDSRMIFAAKRLAEASGLAAMEATLTERLGLVADAWSRQAVGSVIVPQLAALEKVAARLSGSRNRLTGIKVSTRGYGGDATRWRAHRAAASAAAMKAGEATPEEVEAEVDLAWSRGGGARADLQNAWRDAVDPDAWREARFAFSLQRDRSAGLVAGVSDEAVTTAMDELLKRIQTPSLFDFAAVARSLGLPTADAMRRAALYFDMLVRSRALISEVSGTAIAEALLARESITTKSLHQACGVGGSASIARAAVDADLALQCRAEALASARGRRFPISVPDGTSDEQLLAINLAAQGRKLALVVGVAGSGKTHALKAVASGAKRAEMKIIATARNAARAAETGEAIGADRSATLETLLADERIGVGQPVLIVVDETGVVDKIHVESLLALAEDAARQVQIVALGDRQQAQAIDGFSAYASLLFGAERAGAVVRLQTSRRCARWAKEAGEIRAGQGTLVLDRALTDGRLVTATTEADVVKTMADAVLAHRGAIALTISNAQAAAVAREIQKALGKVGVFPINHDNRAAVGDRVRTRLNDRCLGVMNGDEWVVRGVGDDFLVVSGKRGKNIKLPAVYCAAFVELAYASTIDSAQGITAERAIVRVDSSVGRSRLYSAATRGKTPPIYVCTGGNAAEILAAAVYRDDIDRTAGEIAAEITARVAPETEYRQTAESQLREDLALLRDAVADIKEADLMTSELIEAQNKITAFYRFRRDQLFAEADEQERLDALICKFDLKLSGVIRDRAMAEHLEAGARSRIASLETSIRNRNPTPIWSQQQRAQDLDALYHEVAILAQEATDARVRERAFTGPFKENISALASAADAVRWQTRHAVDAAETAIRPELDRLIGVVLKARGQPAQPEAPPPPPELRSPDIIKKEIITVKLKSDEARGKQNRNIGLLKTILKPDDPAIVAAESHAIAVITSYRLQIIALEQELEAAQAAQQADYAYGDPRQYKSPRRSGPAVS